MGFCGSPSSFFASPIFVMPSFPSRITSASPSITRTVRPQPAGQSGQMLGFQTATPGTSCSSGTNRIRRCSGFPQLVSVTLVPVSAECFMNWRRSISVVAGEAIVRRASLFVTVDTKAHRVIDHALGDDHLRQIPMTRGTVDTRAKMGCVVETHVRFFDESVHALPRHVFAAV